LSAAQPVGILLAAGAGTRFRSDKLVHPLADGTPIAVASLANLRAALPRVVAVVRPGSEALARRLADAGAEVTVCAEAEQGMGHSLAHAVRAAGTASVYVIALGDMPFIRPDTIRSVADRVAAGALLAAPRHGGERGHPVAFAAGLRGALEASTGDAGAREVIRAHAHDLALVDVDDAGVVRDIDTPGDLDRV
jgi:molybdenum cofactor cytidylyltransferase